jgi:hypothetical protein
MSISGLLAVCLALFVLLVIVCYICYCLNQELTIMTKLYVHQLTRATQVEAKLSRILDVIKPPEDKNVTG